MPPGWHIGLASTGVPRCRSRRSAVPAESGSLGSGPSDSGWGGPDDCSGHRRRAAWSAVRDAAAPLTPLHRFLTLSDLEELAGAEAALRAAGVDVESRQLIAATVHDWVDVQALANLLMYPQLIDDADRVPAVQRGLSDPRGYLRLAAAVGVGELQLAEIDEAQRFEFVRLLLGILQTDVLPLADRASFALVWVLHPSDAPDLVAHLTHPSPTVRHNLIHGLLGVLDTAGLAALLDGPGFVAPETQRQAQHQLAADGIDLSGSSEALVQPLIVPYLPDYAEWTAAFGDT
jgi:hypothetical protein